MYNELIKNVNKRRKEICELAKNNNVWIKHDEKYMKSIKKVLIIVSASRSGSSLMFDLIKRYPNIISTSGEAVPFYKLTSLASDERPSDAISELEVFQENKMSFLKELSGDLHKYDVIKEQNNSEFIQSYAYQLALRFIIQWPIINFDCKDLVDCIKGMLESTLVNYNDFDKNVVILNIIIQLRKKYPQINPYYYDISKDEIEKILPKIEKPIGPPNLDFLIEEPPFIVIDPITYIDPNMFQNYFLLMKEPVTSYRLKMIKKIFSNTEFYWIYLTRNPAACINGLMDGWLDRGFFSSNISNCISIPLKKMNIKGYSELNQWSKSWWNFDRPPGWEKMTNRSLAEVCAFQWKANNKAIIEGLKQEKNKIIIKYEDILSYKKRKAVFKKIEDFIGASSQLDTLLDINKLPIVQSTKEPRMYRWREREGEILDAIENSELNELAYKLGYKKERMEEWL